MKAINFDEIKIGGELGRRFYLTINENLRKIDIDGDFLVPMKEKIDTKYTGIGALYLSVVYFYAYSKLDSVLDIRNHILDFLISVQEPDGYIGYKTGDRRVWTLFDTDEICMLLLALANDYKVFQEERVLESAKKLAHFYLRQFKAHPDKKPYEDETKMSDSFRFISLPMAFMALYEETKDEEILDYLLRCRKLPEWTHPIDMVGRWGDLGNHGACELTTCLAQLKLYKYYPDSRLLRQIKRLIDFFLYKDGMVITGAVSDLECFHDSQSGGRNLGETCATTFYLACLSELIKLENRPIYGDIIERILYNALFAAQSPDGRRLRYYTAFERERVYWPDDMFCCANNFKHAMSRMPELLYYTGENHIYINLLNASEYTTTLKNGIKVKIKQITDYPKTGKVKIMVEPEAPVFMTITVRIPAWCKKIDFTINGQPGPVAVEPGQSAVVQRVWQKNDCIDLNMDMPFRFIKGRKAQSGKAAIMRGPVVYCLSREQNPDIDDAELWELVIKTDTIEGPFDDDSLREGGTSCRIKAWSGGVTQLPGEGTEPKFTLNLTEYIDPLGVATYFKVPNPRDPILEDDELIMFDPGR